MQSRFIDFIRANNLVSSNEKILLGVSGGVDSMVMLNLFYKSGFSFSVAHCNFSLRGKESDGDEALASKTCDEKGIEFFCIRFETEKYAQENKLSIQVAARNLRYDWFSKLCGEHRFSKIAIAHNRDDVAETLILNLTRGTGLKGLSGIKMINGRIIRPLLDFSRNEILVYANEHSIAYREDSSNSSVKYARNRIRHNVLPELEKLNPSAKRSISETANHVHEAWNLVDDYLLKLKKEIVTTDKERFFYSIPVLLKEKYSKLFLFEELTQFGFSYDTIEQVVKSFRGQSGKVFYSSTHQLLHNRDYLELTERKEIEKMFVRIDNDCLSIDSPINLKFHLINKSESYDIPRNAEIASLDFDKLTFPLELRPWNSGDKFMPFGMAQFKKVSDFLIDLKVSLVDKEKVYVLTSNNEIVWVVGMRIDNRYKVDNLSQRVYRIEQRLTNNG